MVYRVEGRQRKQYADTLAEARAIKLERDGEAGRCGAGRRCTGSASRGLIAMPAPATTACVPTRAASTGACWSSTRWRTSTRGAFAATSTSRACAALSIGSVARPGATGPAVRSLGAQRRDCRCARASPRDGRRAARRRRAEPRSCCRGGGAGARESAHERRFLSRAAARAAAGGDPGAVAAAVRVARLYGAARSPRRSACA